LWTCKLIIAIISILWFALGETILRGGGGGGGGMCLILY
jgi:hypothetical protein